MADITMCEGAGCTLKENCYRFTATPCEYRQSYFVNIPVVTCYHGGQDCDEYWPNKAKAELMKEASK